MTTLTQDRFDFSFYTEQSGSFLVPEKCNGELLVIASGGGGGGGGASGDKLGPGPSGGASGAGQDGGDGGDTTLQTIEGDIVFRGYAGGSGGAPLPSPTSQSIGHAGQPAENFKGKFYVNQPSAPYGAVYLNYNEILQNRNINSSAPYSSTPALPDNILSIYEKSGGSGFSSSPAPVTEVYINLARSAEGLNAGLAGTIPDENTSLAGGGGGNAIGKKKKIKVKQGELIDISIGSGGNGGNGGIGATSVPGNRPSGSSGGAGAGGFVYLFWNED